MTEQSPPLRSLDALCFELDGDRPFFMTSPLYGMAHGGYMFYFDRQGGCEGYRTIFEETRKQWPRCSMAINWCYDEPWKTAGNNSIIEYPTTPKPCYDFIKDALRPALFSARIRKFSWSAGEVFDPELWLLNDSSEKISGSLPFLCS